ncbi:MAG: hypothetical protein IT578_10085 [Verrucomicrobiae bacterium]|nr:hypothetical protein [Verrucomicrobiae bacterium]
MEIKRHARMMKVLFYAPSGWVEWWRGLLRQLLPKCRRLGRLAEAPSG